MDKEILIQYCDMKQEIKYLRERIVKLEKQIEKIEKEGSVKDIVSGGMGGIQHFPIEGFPFPEHDRTKILLQARRAMLVEKEAELLELTNQAEEYIASIEKSELRIMFRLYYIDGLTWVQVAYRMNRMFPKRRIAYTDVSCKKRNERYFKKN